MVFQRLLFQRGSCVVKNLFHPQQPCHTGGHGHGPHQPQRWFRRERCQHEEEEKDKQQKSNKKYHEHCKDACGCGDEGTSGRRFDFAQCQWRQRLSGALQWGALLGLGWTLVHPKWWECRMRIGALSKCPINALCEDAALRRASAVLSALPVNTAVSTKDLELFEHDEGLASSPESLPPFKEGVWADRFDAAWKDVNARGVFSEREKSVEPEEERVATPVEAVVATPLEKATSDLNHARDLLLARMESNDGIDLLLSGEAVKGLGLLRSAAGRGDAEAMHNLGVAYEQGVGVPRNLRKAVKWFRRAAKRQHVGAMMNLAAMQREGLGGLVQDPLLADILVTSAEQVTRGISTNTGEDCSHCVASELNDADIPSLVMPEILPSPNALYELGRQREHGLSGMAKDETYALELYRKAKAQGHKQAKVAFKELREKIVSVGVKKTESFSRLNSKDSGVPDEEEEDSRVALRA